MVIVEVDVAGDTGSQLCHGGEDGAVEVLIFEDGPETFGTGVIETTAGGTHGTDQACPVTELGRLAVAAGVLADTSATA
jgi:hypothetical protein